MPAWLEDLLAGVSAWQALLWIAAVVLLVGVVVKLWPFVRNAVQIVDALVKLPSLTGQVTSLVDQVSDIHHETHNNQGTSIKDSVDRIEQSLKGVHGRMDTVEKDIGGFSTDLRQLRDVDADQSRKIDGLTEKLDDHLEWATKTVARLDNKEEK